ncbi:hypothetical protein Tco_0203705, partial [Tanacetum coccineum]
DPYEEAAQQALEQASPPLSLAYVPDPMELEDHPLPADASPDSDPEEGEEDPDEDPADGGDDDDDESSDDDDDDDDDDDVDEEEEEHLAPADSTAVASPAIDIVPSAEETEPFETDESAATPPPPPAYRTASRMSV